MSDKSAAIAAHHTECPVTVMCRMLAVSRAGCTSPLCSISRRAASSAGPPAPTMTPPSCWRGCSARWPCGAARSLVASFGPRQHVDE